MKIERLDKWRPIGAYITSGDGEDDKPACTLVLYLRWWSVRIPLPAIVRPEAKQIRPAVWDAATIARLGRDYYIDYTRRDYGFMFSGDGFFQLFLGRQTDDSSTEQRWSCFLPWTQWRFMRHSLYGLDGEHVWTQTRAERAGAIGSALFNDWYHQRELVLKEYFGFFDFDGEYIIAKTMIEEREWHRGERWCKWLSWFYAPKIRRSLDIEFSQETGPRKGSWKGGTLGHGIDTLPGELHEAAFRRYCIEHKMKFHGPETSVRYDVFNARRAPVDGQGAVSS